MNTVTLIINQEKDSVRLLHKMDGNVRVIKGSYIPLQKWNRLIKTLDQEFKHQTILGQDLEDHSYQTLQYDNGIWVHCEPYEFLIDYHNQNEVEQLKSLIGSAGYKITRIDEDKKRISIELPY